MTPFLLAVLATVAGPKPVPETPLADLARRPARFIGLTVHVVVTVTEVTADGGYAELVARDRDGKPVHGLKFRAARRLADAVEESLDEESTKARLTGTVLGPDGGRGPYVIQLDEVAVLHPDGSVAERHVKPVETPKPAPPAKIEVTTKAEPAPPAEPTPEPPAGLPLPQLAVLGGVGLLAAGGIGLVVVRRGKKAPAPAETAKPAATVNDRLARRVR